MNREQSNLPRLLVILELAPGTNGLFAIRSNPISLYAQLRIVWRKKLLVIGCLSRNTAEVIGSDSSALKLYYPDS
jgi:hypothetical protein